MAKLGAFKEGYKKSPRQRKLFAQRTPVEFTEISKADRESVIELIQSVYTHSKSDNKCGT
jgi:hypothetical protein